MLSLSSHLKGRLVPALALTVVVALAFGIAAVPLAVWGQTIAPNDGPGWTEPKRVLPYVGRTIDLCTNPLDGSISYAVASDSWGVISGNDLANWENGVHLTLDNNNGAQYADCSYDEFGTLHVIWSARTNTGFHIFYNRVLRGSNNVGLTRDLTPALGDGRGSQTLAHLAYSPQQQKLFMLYFDRGSGDADTINVVESADQGTTWSQPVVVAAPIGSSAPPDIIVDKVGVVHVVYGEFSEDGASKLFHRYRLSGTTAWSSPVNILPGGRGRPLQTRIRLDRTSGDIYVSWTDNVADVARRDAASGQWSVATNASGSPKSSIPTLAVGSDSSVWLLWHDAPAQGILYRVSRDRGVTWSQTRFAIFLPHADIANERVLSIQAEAARDKIYLSVTADQTNPLYYQGPTLFLTSIGATVDNPPTPTPNPNITPTPPGSGTPTPTAGSSPPTITPLPPTATPTSAAPTATPLLTPTPTLTPSNTPPGDQYEPDSTVEEALANNRYIQPGSSGGRGGGASQAHTMFNPQSSRNSYRDFDIVLMRVEAGRTYTVEVEANSFQPKLSLYRYLEGAGALFVGAANSCRGDTKRLCYNFTPREDGVYYAQFSNFKNEPGDPALLYTVRVVTAAATSVSPTATANSRTATAGAVTPTVVAIASPSVTPVPPPTATPVPPAPTQAPTAVPVPPAPVYQPPPPPALPPPAPTATPVPPTATATAPATASPVPPSATPVPPLTAQAQQYEQAQAEAARTPQFLVVPVVPGAAGGNNGGGGIGPEIVPATPSPSPSPRPTATPTPTRIPPTATVAGPTARPSVVTTVTPAPSVPPAAAVPPPAPPPTGPVWLLPLGLAVLGKGLLNLMVPAALKP